MTSNEFQVDPVVRLRELRPGDVQCSQNCIQKTEDRIRYHKLESSHDYMVSIPKLTLTYFNFGGRAEPLRLAAAIGKIPFTHKAIDFKDWAAVKPTTPLGHTPFIEIEEPGKETQVVAESMAILRYLGKLGGLYPEDPIEAMKVDSILDTCEEASTPIVISVAGPVRFLIADERWSKEKVLEVRKRIAENKERGLPFFFSYFEKVLKENGTGWLVGDKVTIADLGLHRLTVWVKSGIIDGVPATLLDDYPHVNEHDEKVESIPEVVDWRQKHPTPYTDFDFNP